MLQLSRRYGITVLVAFLFCIYTFTNAGHFHIVDEVSLFAVTESLALRGSVDTNGIAWTQWVNSPGEVLGAFGNEGRVYSKKGPAPAFLAVPWYAFLRFLARRNIAFGLLQATLLWNGLVTALTAALLWLTAVRLGYRDRTGMLLGLLFGVSTIAWPYANHFFGEPMSALALLTCYYGILSWRQSYNYGWLWLAGIGGGIVITTVTAHLPLVAILEVYLFYLIWHEARHPQSNPALAKQGAKQAPLSTTTLAWGTFHFLAPIALAGMLLLWYNLVRFGSPFATGYHFDSGEGFTTPIWQGLWGLLLSPYRGIFWHTPLLIASIVGFPRFWRQHRSDGWVILALTLTLLVLYSMWWMWWGGYAWGPRFLVPLTPFLVLVMAELLQSGVEEQPKSGWRSAESPAAGAYSDPSLQEGGTSLIRYNVNFATTAQVLAYARTRMPLWLWPLAAISTLVQILAVSLNYVNYESQLRAIFPTDWRNPLAYGPPAQAISDLLFSPVVGQWRLLRQGWLANSDLVWLPADGDVKWLLVLVGVAAIATLLYLVYDWWRWAVAYDVELPGLPVRTTVLLVPLVLMAVWLGETASDPHYGVANTGYRRVLDTLCAEARIDDSAISIAPTAYQIPMNWLGTACGVGVPILGYASDSATHPEAVEAMQHVLATSNRLWYITGGLQANDPENSVERWLAQNGYKASDDWYDDYRLVRYATEKQLEGTPALPHNAQLSATFDGNDHRVTIIASKAPVAGLPGDFVPIRIEYLLNTPATADLRWFVQVLSQEGAAVAQLDTGPEDNYVTFSSLPVNQLQIERAGLYLPPDLAPGQYRLIAGLYNPAAGGERLRLNDSSDTVLLSFITIDLP